MAATRTQRERARGCTGGEAGGEAGANHHVAVGAYAECEHGAGKAGQGAQVPQSDGQGDRVGGHSAGMVIIIIMVVDVGVVDDEDDDDDDDDGGGGIYP